ncbi:amidohydrolase [Halodesulfurarchaeum formicicum]|uniref:Amidohydrolase n=1 Tax=Halodesulfurarchaeum formicicum TaxID=1873524 RepID=A0A1D8S5J6_9EURY|nr:amidohydrolase family protein [Halodesulfurarchaeum formicicum]AOW80624.1 amidohydrolase [Halodesulfurarchaeum formicicum]APE95963.1 amidohydrolase [Halodesulfurarchaeum formicicum]
MLELEHGFQAVDVNARLDPGPGQPIRGKTIDAEGLERELHQAGIAQAVVAPGPVDDERGYLRANNAIARQAVERPFLAVARLDGPRAGTGTVTARLKNTVASPEDEHTTAEDVEQYAYDDRFFGFKLDPGRDGLPTPAVLDALEDVGLPVLVEGGTAFPPERVDEHLLGRSMPVVLAHFGGYPADRGLMTEAIDLLDRRDSLYLDTSAVRFRDLLERAIMEHPDRVLFGSHSPTVHPDVAVMEVLTLDVPENSMARVFTKNPVRVIPELEPA